MPYVGKNPDLNASVDTNELADDAVTLGKIGEDFTKDLFEGNTKIEIKTYF